MFSSSPNFANAHKFANLIRHMQNFLNPDLEFKLVAKNDAEMAMIHVIVKNLDSIANYAQVLIDKSKSMVNSNVFDELNRSLDAFFNYLENPPSPADFKEAARLSTRAADQMKNYTDRLIKPQNVEIVAEQGFYFEAVSEKLRAMFVTALQGRDTTHPLLMQAEKFNRRITVMAMAGGFPVDYLNSKSFALKFEHYDKSKIVLNPVRPDVDTKLAEESYSRMMQSPTIDREAQVSLFWYPILVDYFNDIAGSMRICKDFDLKPSLDLDAKRKSDIVIMSSRFNLPILTIDVSETPLKHGSEHPKYIRTMTNMTVSCIQLAEQMKNCGLDPEDARTFGILIGQDKAHLLYCFPTISRSSAQERRKIYTCVFMNDTWLLDFSCKLYDSNAVLNVNAYKKLSAFLDTVKDSIKKYEVKVANPEKNAVKNDFDKPNISYVAKPRTKIDLLTREEKLKVNYNEGVVTSQQATKSELQFYKTKLADYFAFPKLLEFRVESDGSVTLTLEKLLPLMGNGIFGPYGSGKCFCPGVIRAENADSLMIDAAVFAVNALFGLFVLHEQLRHLHANISPETVKYSQSDRMWKLTGFESVIPLKEAVKTVRKCNDPSNIFISPETKKSGIFDKKSDVYALGKVIWNTFHIQIMWLLECGETRYKTSAVHDKFCDIIRKMTYDDPSKRSSVLQSMKMMMDFIKENPFN